MTKKKIKYGHATLTEQLDRFNIGGLEFDVNYDSKGAAIKRDELIALLKQ